MTLTIWKVSFGKSVHVYYTEYHADQTARALRLNGTPVIVSRHTSPR